MTTGNDSRNLQAAMPTELAHRCVDGVEVLLLWDSGDDRLTVVVDDLRNGGSFELVADDGRQALDAFYHPFAYAAARGLADWIRVVGEKTLVPASPRDTRE
jgi:hypothetical protein